MRLFFPICLALLLLGFPAQATEKTEKPCEPIASLFGETVCRGAFREEKPQYLEAMKVPEDKRPEIAAQMMTRNREQLMDMLWQKALAHKFGADSITPTEADVKKYSTEFKKTMKTSYEADKQTTAYLKEVLKKKQLPQDAQEKIKGIIRAAEAGIKYYEQREQQLSALPAEYRFISEAAETEVARNLIRHWKADKILFDVYRGRLLMGPHGPEPVDAYIAFLKYIDEKGAYEASDPDYTDIFKNIRDRAEAGWEALAPESEIYKNYFRDPTWQFTLSNSQTRLEDLKKWISDLTQGQTEKK